MRKYLKIVCIIITFLILCISNNSYADKLELREEKSYNLQIYSISADELRKDTGDDERIIYAKLSGLVKDKMRDSDIAGRAFKYLTALSLRNGSNIVEFKSDNYSYIATIDVNQENNNYIVKLKKMETYKIIKEEINTSVDPIENPDFYTPGNNTGSNNKFVDIANTVIGIFRLLGTVIAVITLMVIGIRYMFGSVESRANYKETIVPYLIGAVMVFTIPNLLGIIYDLVKAINF